MKNRTFFFLSFIFLGLFQLSQAQTYFTKEATIVFHSKTPLEEILATNEKAISVLNTETGELEFSVLIKGFFFKNALMQTHFNENYMDSDNFPKATFKSKNVDLSAVQWEKDGIYDVPVIGDLTIKGKTNEISVMSQIVIKDQKVSGTAKFTLDPEAYEIEIPSLVRGKIAKEIEVNISTEYQVYAKS